MSNQGCDCLEKGNKALAERNTKIGFTLNFSDGTARVALETEVLTPKRGARPALVIPTYCPFCGKAYPDANKMTEKRKAKR